MTIRLPLVLVVAVLTLAFSIPALAQTDGRLNGVVRDATGAGIAGATITATNQATNATRTASTAADGSYSLALPPGAYTVSVSVPEFRKVSQTVQIAAGASKPIDITLDTHVSEEITVTATKREQTLHASPRSEMRTSARSTFCRSEPIR